jgi:hypothetical protein
VAATRGKRGIIAAVLRRFCEVGFVPTGRDDLSGNRTLKWAVNWLRRRG